MKIGDLVRIKGEVAGAPIGLVPEINIGVIIGFMPPQRRSSSQYSSDPIIYWNESYPYQIEHPHYIEVISESR